jgi:hypothetical protein
MFDEYDCGHSMKYDKTINVYNNSITETIIDDFIKDNNIDTEIYHNKILKKELFETIINGKIALKILDNRKLTKLGFRIFHYECECENCNDDNYKHKCYLINIWRAHYI